jgi:hypothetical protein
MYACINFVDSACEFSRRCSWSMTAFVLDSELVEWIMIALKNDSIALLLEQIADTNSGLVAAPFTGDLAASAQLR